VNTPAPTLKCPTCQKTIEYSDKYPYRPFCSERCKLIDLGEWADENHKIKGNSIYDDILSGDIQEPDY
jgi:endogenous inhibitor of DNA gyrase (YacG/DUF329 family)